MTDSLPTLTDLAGRAALLQAASRAPATERADADWRHFTAWAEANGVTPLPAAPDTVALYLAAHAGTLSVATLERRVAALVVAHRTQGHRLDPCNRAIHDTLAGLRRLHATPSKAKAPLTTDELTPILAALPDDLAGARGPRHAPARSGRRLPPLRTRGA